MHCERPQPGSGSPFQNDEDVWATTNYLPSLQEPLQLAQWSAVLQAMRRALLARCSRTEFRKQNPQMERIRSAQDDGSLEHRGPVGAPFGSIATVGYRMQAQSSFPLVAPASSAGRAPVRKEVGESTEDLPIRSKMLNEIGPDWNERSEHPQRRQLEYGR